MAEPQAGRHAMLGSGDMPSWKFFENAEHQRALLVHSETRGRFYLVEDLRIRS